MTSTYISINGDLALESEVAIFSTNSSYSLGLGVFTTLLWDKKNLLNWEAHLARLAHSCQKMFATSWDCQTSQQEVQALLHANQLQNREARIRITLSEQLQQKTEQQTEQKQNQQGLLTLIQAAPYKRPAQGVRLCLSPFRVNPWDALTGHKTTSYSNYFIALKTAKKAGGDEALMLNTEGFLCEGSTSNLFFLKQGILYTPSLETGCLPGIMRAEVLKFFQTQQLNVQQGRFSLEQLQNADAAFITNSLRRVQMVASLDEKKFPSLEELLKDTAYLKSGEILQSLLAAIT